MGALLATLMAAGRTNAQVPEVRVSGSTTVFARVFDKNQDAINRSASARVDVISNGSRQGLLDLATRRSDIAMLSARLDEILERLSATERTRLDPSTLVVTPLTENRLVFVVNASNPVKGLTLKQVADLFTGRVTNWKVVGGPDLPVQVVSNQFSSGQRAVLEDEVLKKETVTSAARLVVNDPLIVGIVRQIPGAIGHAAAGGGLDGVTTIRTDKTISQPMSLVTRGKPQGATARVIAAAQKIVADSH